MTETHSGGCQCGAVRFKANGPAKTTSICHCRMCQKAVGNYFATFVAYNVEAVEFTRGEMKIFKSSNFAQRGFCVDCGTPLSYQWDDKVLSLSIGAFDRPENFMPARQYAASDKVANLDEALAAPGKPLTEDPEEIAFLERIHNHQHPDHDTDVWPARGTNPAEEQ